MFNISKSNDIAIFLSITLSFLYVIKIGILSIYLIVYHSYLHNCLSFERAPKDSHFVEVYELPDIAASPASGSNTVSPNDVTVDLEAESN